MDKIKVLLVEDEETLAMIIKTRLKGRTSPSTPLPTVKRDCAGSSTCAPMYSWPM